MAVSAFTISLEATALADEGRCGLGLVLNVPDATANDIASAVCTEVRARHVRGSVRVGVIQASTLAVTIARVDPSGTEEAVRLDARDANDAIKRAPPLLAAWGEKAPEPPPPSPPSKSASVASSNAPQPKSGSPAASVASSNAPQPKSGSPAASVASSGTALPAGSPNVTSGHA